MGCTHATCLARYSKVWMKDPRMTKSKHYQLFKLKIALFSIYLLSLSIITYLEIFTTYGYVTISGFFQGWRMYPLRAMFLFGEFKDLSGASPAYFLLIPLGGFIFLPVILCFWLSWKKIQTLFLYIVLLTLTLITFKNIYAFRITPWW